MSDPKTPSLALLMKLGGIVVHTGEMMDEKKPMAHATDAAEVRTGLSDPEVVAWIEAMGPLLPLRRDAR